MTDDTDTSPGDTHVTAWVRLFRRSQEILQAVEQALKAEGLPNLSVYDLLLELRRASPDGVRPYELQSRMLIPQYNMSRLIERVEKEGLARREPCPVDGRGHLVHVTQAGRDMLDRMWPVYRRALDQSFASRIDEADARALAGLLAWN
ncbi:MAG: winged helix-turn-helix transcriptional regulator [Silicimonas sp.]|nr:winged helix-turn-helix transcriptional regulator [Silicimonas sp.]